MVLLFFIEAILLDLDKIYIIPLNLPWSLFAPLQLAELNYDIYDKELLVIITVLKE